MFVTITQLKSCYPQEYGLGAPDRILLPDYVGWGKIMAMCGTTVMGVFLLEKVSAYHRRVGKSVPVLIRAVTEYTVYFCWLVCLALHPPLLCVRYNQDSLTS